MCEKCQSSAFWFSWPPLLHSATLVLWITIIALINFWAQKCTKRLTVFSCLWQHVVSLPRLALLCCQDRNAPPWQENPAMDAITPYWFWLTDSLFNHWNPTPSSPPLWYANAHMHTYKQIVINCIVFLSIIYSILLQWPHSPHRAYLRFILSVIH